MWATRLAVGERDPVPLETLAVDLAADPRLAGLTLVPRLAPILASETGTSSAGYPFLGDAAYRLLRDTVPHTFAAAGDVLSTLDVMIPVARELAGPADLEHVLRADRVVRTVLNTAAITAPPDLWLLRHVLGALSGLGLTQRLLQGEAIVPSDCEAVPSSGGGAVKLCGAELEKDLTFVRSRGLLNEVDGGFVLRAGAGVRSVFEAVRPVPCEEPAGVSAAWRRLFAGATLDPHEVTELGRLGAVPALSMDRVHEAWTPTLAEIDVGYRLVPLVVGLRAAQGIDRIARAQAVRAEDLGTAHPILARGALQILAAAGVVETDGAGSFRPTPLGVRLLARGPGPFGIIEAYHPYMGRLEQILVHPDESIWVQRSANVAASQDANRHTFEQLGDSLDAFCAATGFEYEVFIEHALGRGEATRQRFARSGDAGIRYFGADLEDAAMDAAQAEREAGRLPRDMVLIRRADIGVPSHLIAQVRAAGARTLDAVMMVGNGFHEVRNQTDDKMVGIFREYHDAGIVLLFTEANAFSVGDLLATAWNTYHAGFMYVHDKSGQGLRPSQHVPEGHRGRRLRSSWTECATRAGYVRVDRFSSRSRTAYPTTPTGEYNPSISVNHFFVPLGLAQRLALPEAG